MGRRAEFSKPVRRSALKRSGGKCEAYGEWYGLPPHIRCDNDLSYGVEFDHFILAANGGEATIGNCFAVCKRCHAWKTRKRDIPLAAKTLRQQDKARGIKTKHKWPKRPMRAPTPNTRDIRADTEE